MDTRHWGAGQVKTYAGGTHYFFGWWCHEAALDSSITPLKWPHFSQWLHHNLQPLQAEIGGKRHVCGWVWCGGACHVSYFFFRCFPMVFSHKGSRGLHNIEAPFLCVFWKHSCGKFWFQFFCCSLRDPLSMWPSPGCSQEPNHRHRCQMKVGICLWETVWLEKKLVFRNSLETSAFACFSWMIIKMIIRNSSLSHDHTKKGWSEFATFIEVRYVPSCARLRWRSTGK